MPVYFVYQHIQQLLAHIKERAENMNEEKDRRDAAAEFIRNVLGEQTIKSAPDEYYQIDMLLELGGITGYSQWLEMPLIERAKIQAQCILKRMVDVVEAYRREDRRNREKKK